MAGISVFHAAHHPVSLGARIGGLVHTILMPVIIWNKTRMTRDALNALSDRELKDIGLVRGDIDNVSARH